MNRNIFVRTIRGIPRRFGYIWGPRLMSFFRKRWVLLRNLHAEIRFGRHVYLGPGFSLHMPLGGTFEAGDGAHFRRGFRAEIGPRGRVAVGAGTVFTYDVLVQCSTSIEIGRKCLIGQAVFIVDGNHRFRDPEQPILSQGYDYRPIRIGDGSGLMTKCTILADVGERAFIGANSVVSRPIPAFSVAVGAPAKPIDYFGPTDSASAGADRTKSVPEDSADA